MMERHRYFLCLFAGLMAACGPAVALEPATEQARADRPSYAAGELLVKFKPDAAAAIEAARAAGKPLTETGLPWLDALSARYGVTAISLLFPQHIDPQALARKYPERAKRASLDASAPRLAYIYKLTLRLDVDILRAAMDYGAASDVEYAEPNYTATTQRNTQPLP